MHPDTFDQFLLYVEPEYRPLARNDYTAYVRRMQHINLVLYVLSLMVLAFIGFDTLNKLHPFSSAVATGTMFFHVVALVCGLGISALFGYLFYRRCTLSATSNTRPTSTQAAALL
jgi:hypothetical protein